MHYFNEYQKEQTNTFIPTYTKLDTPFQSESHKRDESWKNKIYLTVNTFLVDDIYEMSAILIKVILKFTYDCIKMLLLLYDNHIFNWIKWT